MYTDSTSVFSDNQSITGTTASTDIIDLDMNRDVGSSRQLFIRICIVEAFNNLTDLTVQVNMSANEILTTSDIQLESNLYLLADLIKGKTITLPIPLYSNLSGFRYIGLNYLITGNAPTTGKITAALFLDLDENFKFYSSGYILASS